MSHSRSGFIRWLKFNAVGAIGIGVQLTVLALLRSGLGMNYLLATAVAVEAAVLHNFFWHERFTWADRRTPSSLARLVKFNLSTGGLSIFGNVLAMKSLVGVAGIEYIFANLISIAVCSILNFFVADRGIFVLHSAERREIRESYEDVWASRRSTARSANVLAAASDPERTQSGTPIPP